MKLMVNTPGTSSHAGMASIDANIRTMGTFMTNSITLAINSEAISPHTNSGWLSNKTGPGVML